MNSLYSPTGRRIIGTCEVVYGWAGINEAVPIIGNPRDGFKFQYDGETRLDWNSQETQCQNGHRVFLDEDGGTWPEPQLHLAPTPNA